jgi:FkbM family methyltransferase
VGFFSRSRRQPPAVQSEQVAAAFEMLLGRQPANDQEIASALALGDLRALVDHLIGSAEFRERYARMYGAIVARPPRPAPIFLGDRVLAWTHRGQRIYLVPQDVDLTPHIMRDGAWENHVEQTLLRFVRPGHAVIDLGANVGYHTLLLCSAVAPTGRVYAFEPQPRLVRLLKATIFVNDLHPFIEIHCCAASDRPGSLILSSSPDHYGSGNVSPGHSTPNFEEDYSEKIEAPAVRLDDTLGDRLASVQLMHLDIEGAEPLALRGAQALVERSPELKIITEWSVEMMAARADMGEFVRWLDGMGFRFWWIDQAAGGLSPVSRDNLLNLPHGDLLLSRADPG